MYGYEYKTLRPSLKKLSKNIKYKMKMKVEVKVKIRLKKKMKRMGRDQVIIARIS
jgi:hypothetical protein